MPDPADNVVVLPGARTPQAQDEAAEARRSITIETLREWADRIEAGEPLQLAAVLRSRDGYACMFSSQSASMGVALAEVLKKGALDRFMGVDG